MVFLGSMSFSQQAQFNGVEGCHRDRVTKEMCSAYQSIVEMGSFCSMKEALRKSKFELCHLLGCSVGS